MCFFDAPLIGLAQNIWFEQQTTGEECPRVRYRGIGLVFDKQYAFQLGARPVLYEKTEVAKKILPKEEHWRIVNLDLTNEQFFIDWTHEREWRWPNRRSTGFLDYDIPDDDDPRYAEWHDWSNRRERDRAEEDGLCLDAFSEVAILVRTTRQANLIRRDVLWLADAGVTRNNLYSFILTGEGLDRAHRSGTHSCSHRRGRDRSRPLLRAHQPGQRPRPPLHELGPQRRR